MAKRKHKVTAEQWNAQHPVGTRVRCYPVVGEEDLAFDTKTRSEAWTLGSGEPVVSIEGRPGGYGLFALKVLP